MALSLPYYYGHSGEQYAFFRIPKLLITDSRFDGVSSDAKLLYGLRLIAWSCPIGTVGLTTKIVSLSFLR